MADGTTSLYLSSGGGVIGAGSKPAVRGASDALLAAAQKSVREIRDEDDGSAPKPGEFRFHVVTEEGARCATATVQELGAGAHPLSPLFAATQDVITALREASPG